MLTDVAPGASLRPATPDDLPLLKEMCYLAAFPSEGQNASAEAWDIAGATEEGAWLHAYLDELGSREGDYALVAVDEHSGKDVGAAWYRKYEKDGMPPHELSIAVREGQQGRRIGEKLLNGIREHAKQEGIAELALLVGSDNTGAKRFYSRVGFTAISHNDDGYELMTSPTNMVIKNSGAAQAETATPQLAPHERAGALFAAMPEVPGTGDKDDRLHVCNDGSQVYAVSAFGGKMLDFYVKGPADGPMRDGTIGISFDFEGDGSLRLPQVPVMLGNDHVAVTYPNPNASPLGADAQHAVLDNLHRIVDDNKYHPFGFTLPKI